MNISLNGSPTTQLPRGRSQSLTVMASINDLGAEVGGTSGAGLAGGGAAVDDLYINDIPLRRGFASEFVAMLEVGYPLIDDP